MKTSTLVGMNAGARWWAAVTAWRALEYCYAVILLCCLTLGTVTFFWTNRLPAGSPDVSEAVNWTFVLIQLPSVALLAHRVDHSPMHAVWALAGLVGWLTLSMAWSAVPTVSLVAASSLILTCCAGIYLARSFSWTQLVALIFLAMQPGLVVSRVAIERDWLGFGGISPPQGISGIYGNRNSLGPPAVFAVGCGVVLIAVMLGARTRSRLRVVGALAVLAVIIFDLDLQRRAESTTSWMMLGAFLGTVVILTIACALPATSRRPDLGVLVGRIILMACAAAFVIAIVFNEEVSQAFGRPPGFSHRTEYWAADLDGISDRPILGWGWMAAWRSDEFRLDLSPALATDFWSHSAYLDVVLGGGIVAAALGIVVLVVGTRSAGQVVRRDDVASTVPLALVVAVAVGCTEESFFIGNYFLTALLVAGLCAATGRGANEESGANSLR